MAIESPVVAVVGVPVAAGVTARAEAEVRTGSNVMIDTAVKMVRV